jgi:hypothetical protein
MNTPYRHYLDALTSAIVAGQAVRFAESHGDTAEAECLRRIADGHWARARAAYEAMRPGRERAAS